MRNSRWLIAALSALVVAGTVAAGCSSNGDDDQSEAAPAAVAPADAGSNADTSQAPAAASRGNEFAQQLDMSITFTSSVFNEKKRIPSKHTCTKISANVPNISPPIMWEGLPDGTVSLALIMDSAELPDNEEQVHWILWNLPPDTTELLEGVPNTETLDSGAVHGTNGDGTIGYYGPCPPPLVPRSFDTAGGANVQHQSQQQIQEYTFRIFALDMSLDLTPGATKAELVKAIDGHVLAAGELVGERQGKIIRKE